MEYCPACKSELSINADSCSICNHKLDCKENNEWCLIGSIQDNISSEFAKETLNSYNIPVVVISNSGMFGTVGLPLNPFYGKAEGLFNVSVPQVFAEEAAEILNMILGKSWTKKV